MVFIYDRDDISNYWEGVGNDIISKNKQANK